MLQGKIVFNMVNLKMSRKASVKETIFSFIEPVLYCTLNSVTILPADCQISLDAHPNHHINTRTQQDSENAVFSSA